MALNLAIECADRSVRWYLTPGQTSRYEIIVINQSGDEAAVCTMALDDPPGGGTFEPPRFSLRPRERKTVTLTFAETTQVPRDQRALISVRDTEGIVVASFEHGLISAGGTDCTVTLTWKEPIIDGDEVRGFAISCAIKSLSASPGMFALQFTPHPSLEFVDVAPIKLEPGQSVTVAIPILWKRARKDAEGYNHPRTIEIGVAVSQGRRTGRLSWDMIERKLAALKAPAPPPPPAPPKPVSSDANGPAESAKQAAAPAPSAPSAAEDLTLFFVNGSGASDSAQAPEKKPPREAARSETAPAPEKAPPARQFVRSETASVPEKAPPLRQGVRSESVPAAEKTPPPREAPREEPHRDVAPPMPDSGAMDDDALMSLLVGKPVSPPTGWRSPGRDAPDASEAPPPSIFAKTPTSLTGVPPTPPPRPIEAPAPPAPEPAAPSDEFVPPAPPRHFRQLPPLPLDEEAVPPAARPQLPPDLSGVDVDPYAYEAPSEPVAFEGSIVGPPPSHSRTLEIEREHKALARRAAEESERAPSTLEGKLPVIVMGGTAIIAIALVAFFLMHPFAPAVKPQAVPSATVPPPVVLENVAPTMKPRPGAKPKAKVPKVAPSVATHAAEHIVATSAPVPATHPPAHVAIARRPHPSARRPYRYPRPKPTSIVMLAGIYARYGASGHAVRVIWGASSQASAEVQLSDERGSVISHTTVAGQRQNALLYLPRSYYGSVYIQVVSIGYQGERVTQSSYLPPFSP